MSEQELLRKTANLLSRLNDDIEDIKNADIPQEKKEALLGMIKLNVEIKIGEEK